MHDDFRALARQLQGDRAANAGGCVAARYHTPRERLLGVFDVQGGSFSEPGFRGCPFVSACAEARPGSTTEEAAEEARAWIRSLFVDLAKQACIDDPERLARQLVLVYDGAGIAAWMDRDSGAAAGLALSLRPSSTLQRWLDRRWHETRNQFLSREWQLIVFRTT